MKSFVMLAALLVAWCVLQARAAPRMSRDSVNSQACGDKLAELLSLVCSGRGYNVAFRPEQNTGRRFKRGIVEECCHRSCSFALLELYCREDPTEEVPSNLQIRKRSDTEALRMEQSGESSSPHYDSQENNENKVPRGNTIPAREGEDSVKIINLLNPFKHSKHNSGRSTSNETTEDDERSLSLDLPALRHHKKHHHGRHGSRTMRIRQNAAKTQRQRTKSEESTFQIGTVKPYFVRSSNSHRSNLVE